MAFDTEYPKWSNMVDIKRSLDLKLSCTAKLASEAIALARLAPLSFPIWAVIRLIATFPIRMSLARDISGLPQAITVLAAKYRSVLAMPINTKDLTALAAWNFDLSTLPVVAVFTKVVGRHPLATAGTGAKAAHIGGVWIHGNMLSALLARYENLSALPVGRLFAHMRKRCPLPGALLRACDSLICVRRLHAKPFMANRAFLVNTARSARVRAKAGIILCNISGRALERLSARLANEQHGISSNEKTLVGHTSDWCRSNQDDRTRVKHNDTRTRQWVQSGCYLIASTGVV